MRLRALQLLLVVPFTSTIGFPDCVLPPPPPASVPTIADCDQLLRLITIISRVQQNMPLTWSRHPPAIAGQKLPSYYTYGPGNDCELIVDVKGGREVEYESDVFATRAVATRGRFIVELCLVSEAGATVGSDNVGPREIVQVRLRKKGMERAAGGFLNLLNGTLLGSDEADGAMLERILEGAENVSGIV